MNLLAILSVGFLTLIFQAPGKDAPGKVDDKKTHPIANMRLRSIGPAVFSGRVVGFAVNPTDRSKYYAAVASGGVWKTNNAGVTWSPIFDNEGSYSIGCITMDPKNSNVLWVGTGENNSQRSVGYGDGVYKSIDGGKNWTNMGLKNSEHIAKIMIDPRDSDTVYVCAQGPLWGPGGDRGLYKTTDGGKTWNKILNVSENTGITALVQDPRNPDVMVAASYQRRRHVYTLVNGGPESAIYRTSDGGKTWGKVRSGLPMAELGRIGLAMAPSDPDVIYAVVEAAEKQGGIFRSADRGITWEKRNPYDSQAQYYAHVVVDPVNKDRIYVMNVYIQVSDDGGRTLRSMTERWKHVDNHEIWIDPKNPDYYLVGCDGGIYESFDKAANWRHISNLPVTQFYDVTCEQIDSPFYKVYGGTQDNTTLGGPARNMSLMGITNNDWTSIVGGDGFQTRIDPKDPQTVYAEYQYGGLVRFDWRTGQRVSIAPQAAPGEPPLRWNWDSPIIISPHKNTRLYFAANKLFKSEDRGDNWTSISPDLSRQLNRDSLPVYGKILTPEAVAKHLSTSYFGNITALSESPKKEGLIYVGTDDGLIQVTEDGGKNWMKLDKFPGVPDMTYVARLHASSHDANTVYAVMDNHKNADFAPYVLKSTDKGNSWISISGDLPPRGSALAIAEDHVNPKLLFIGTEFGLYFTAEGGNKWHRIKNGLPCIAVRDLVIQEKMSDLVVATFGRGFYILDDYGALRDATPESLTKDATLFPVRDGFLYQANSQFGGRGKGFLGEALYAADNPGFGATITYHLKEGVTSAKKQRQDAQKKDEKSYPTQEQLRAEAEEEEATVLLTISDEAGKAIRVLTGSASAGVNRVTWDLRHPATSPSRRPVADDGDEESFFSAGGILVSPGKYTVKLARKAKGEIKELAGPVNINVRYVGPGALTPDASKELVNFQEEITQTQKQFTAVQGLASDISSRLEAIKAALDPFPAASQESKDRVRKVLSAHKETLRKINGDNLLRGRNENTPTSLSERMGVASEALRLVVFKPTGTHRDQLKLVQAELPKLSIEFKDRLEKEVKELEKYLDSIGAPWTPGRLPK